VRLLVGVAVGGAAGAVCRYGLVNALHSVLGRGFPYGTLAVNGIGSLLMGLLYVLFLERLMLSSEWRATALVGFLGAFTTFSTFSIETLNLVEDGAVWKAALNVALSVLVCLAAAWLGVNVGRQL
jgi:CrcB protein